LYNLLHSDGYYWTLWCFYLWMRTWNSCLFYFRYPALKCFSGHFKSICTTYLVLGIL
jgi:hypothetical protein